MRLVALTLLFLVAFSSAALAQETTTTTEPTTTTTTTSTSTTSSTTTTSSSTTTTSTPTTTQANTTTTSSTTTTIKDTTTTTEGKACPAVYEPVCGEDGATYSNECVARSIPIIIKHLGACEKPLPPECRKEEDKATGAVRVICEGKSACPIIPKEAVDNCREHGGTPEFFTPEGNECELFRCSTGSKFDPLRPTGVGACMPPEEVNRFVDRCKAQGLQGSVEERGSCLVPRCVGKRSDYQFQKIEGCFQESQIPEDAYAKCRSTGGEMVFKKDENACIVFAQCVRRATSDDLHYDSIDKVPEESELLEVAFKLEALRIEFDKLQKKSADIALYYEGTGENNEAEKFKRVSDMFGSAKDAVDKVKTKLRDSLGSLTVQQMIGIKHDVAYIKDVILKNILYVMLSSDANAAIGVTASASSASCGTNGSCFEEAMRLCRVGTTFTPEKDMSIKIAGAEDGRCVLEVFSTQANAGMTCRIPDYAFGITDPQKQVFPHCEGALKAQFESRFSQERFKGPGGCSDEDSCRKVCESDPQECERFFQQFCSQPENQGQGPCQGFRGAPAQAVAISSTGPVVARPEPIEIRGEAAQNAEPVASTGQPLENP